MGSKGRLGPKGPPYPDHEELLRYWQWNDDEVAALQSEIERLREALREISKLKISSEDGVNKYIVFMARSIARAAIGVEIDE